MPLTQDYIADLRDLAHEAAMEGDWQGHHMLLNRAAVLEEAGRWD